MLKYSFCFFINNENNSIIEKIIEAFTNTMDENYITKNIIEFQLLKHMLLKHKVSKIIRIPSSFNKFIKENYFVKISRNASKIYNKNVEIKEKKSKIKMLRVVLIIKKLDLGEQ